MRRTGLIEASFGPLATRKHRRRWRPLRTLLIGGSVLLLCLQLHAHLHLHSERPWQLPADERREAAAVPQPPRTDASDAAPLPPMAVATAAASDAEASSSDVFAAPWLAPLRTLLLQAEPPANRTALGLPAVPWRLHQTWKDAWPPRHLFSPRWRHSMQAANPGWAHRLWTDAENRALVAARYPWLLAAYDGYPSDIQRADVARYVVVHAHGGVYADLDIECFRPFAPLLARHDASVLLSYKQGANFSKGVSNSIFASVAHHPLWDAVFAVLLERANTALAGHRDVLYSTGPAVLREAVRRLLRLPRAATIRLPMLEQLRARLGVVVLDARHLHPTTAERRVEARSAEELPPEALCTHHFVSSYVETSRPEASANSSRQRQVELRAASSLGQPRPASANWQRCSGRPALLAWFSTQVSSWVAHNATAHAATEQQRRDGHAHAAMEGRAQPVRLRTTV